MLDINLIRERPDYVKDGLRKVGADPSLIDEVLELDARWRALTAESEQMRAEQKRKSAELESSARIEGRHKHVHVRGSEEAITELREMGRRAKELSAERDSVRKQLDSRMLEVPNIPHPDAPVGKDASENVVRRTEGEIPCFDFEPKPHWELGPQLGILDFERGVKMSGSRFYVLMREGARLQRALITWMLDLHVKEHGYTEVYPPAVVKRECLEGTGNLPKFEDNLYHDAEDDLWLIPTAEVPLTNLHRDEVLSGDELPKHYVAYTPCFRREKMSAGQDVRGIKRGHQFDKVELMKYVKPGTADEELEKLIRDAEDVCRQLGLPWRLKEMCTGDLSFVACRKFDIEVWAAGCREWLEVSSCSNFRDFQARRANIRYRPADGGGPDLVHTMNGSGLALPRTLIAILENYQQADGSVLVPEVLRPYMGGLERIERQ
jgi:seryl-tRNA synthetase